ncbi:MAG: thiamine-binding protein [Breznakibacter sp.]
MTERFEHKQVNLAIQVLPSSISKHPYDIVDEAIKIIAESGFKYRVTPFETVMEGPYGELMEVVKRVHETCYFHGAESMMCYLKIQSNGEREVTIEDKMAKYDN